MMNSNYKLLSEDNLTLKIKQENIETWHDLTTKVRALPYGRNTNRKDITLVWKEQKGTCSSKHAFLKHVADLNNIPNIELILGIYKMNATNTPKIGTALSENRLDYIPEAHCYLRIDGKHYDFTSPNSNFNKIKNDVLLEKGIEPHQIAKFKVDFHKSYVKDWVVTCKIPFSFEAIWEIRETCISNLSG